MTRNHAQPVSGMLVVKSVELTRPADTTAYAANDVVSDSTSATTPLTIAGVARFNGGSGYIVGMRLVTNLKSITPHIRVHLLSSIASLTVAADNVAYKAVYADIAKRIGSYDLAALSTPADTTNSDLSGVTDFTMRIPFICGAAVADIYVVLETLDIFTPASGEKFTLFLDLDQN